jgi:hypothetical protein
MEMDLAFYFTNAERKHNGAVQGWHPLPYAANGIAIAKGAGAGEAEKLLCWR